jgi:amidase
VPVAHASDGGGSIRIPAACCGLVGLRPSQGRISMGPDRAESGLAVDFVITRSVRDAAAFLDALAGPGVGDNVVAPRPARRFAAEVGADVGPLRVGVLDHRPDGTTVDPAVAAAVARTGRVLEDLGHHVEVGSPPALHDPGLTGHFFVLWAVGRAVAMAGLGRMLGRQLRDDEVEPANLAMVELAGAVTAAAYAEALAAVAESRRRVMAWWADGFDLLLTPTVAGPPPAIGALDPPEDNPLQAMVDAGTWAAFTPAVNTTGQPAVSLPVDHGTDGLPVGVQLVADYGREDLLLAVGAQLESACAWADRRPPGAAGP